MRLLDVVSAKSAWIIDLKEVNPIGKRLLPELFKAVLQRYKFLKYPQKLEELFGTDVKFEQGAFKTGKGDISINLTVFAEGLLAESRSSTSDSDAFLNDLLVWVAREYSLVYDPVLVRKKVHTSEVHVYSEILSRNLPDKLTNFLSFLTQNIERINQTSDPIGIVAVSFGTDPTNMNPVFRFERKIQTAFSENRYYSFATTETEKHLQIITALEEIYSS